MPKTRDWTNEERQVYGKIYKGPWPVMYDKQFIDALNQKRNYKGKNWHAENRLEEIKKEFIDNIQTAVDTLKVLKQDKTSLFKMMPKDIVCKIAVAKAKELGNYPENFNIQDAINIALNQYDGIKPTPSTVKNSANYEALRSLIDKAYDEAVSPKA